jgi:outer membrane lipoprotein-sorting protein
MIVTVVSLLSAALLAQDKAAEEAFKKIEEKIVSAKTVSLNFSIESSKVGDQGAKRGPQMSGSMTLKDGNKGLLIHRTSQFPMDWVRVSDGNKITVSGLKMESETPPNFKFGTLKGLARIGWSPTVFLAFQMLDIGEQGKVFEAFVKSLEVSGVKFEKDQGDAKVLSYRVTCSEPYSLERLETVSVELWYEPKTLHPLKRLVKTKSETVIETYRDWVFNGDVPDEKFKLPEKK